MNPRNFGDTYNVKLLNSRPGQEKIPVYRLFYERLSNANSRGDLAHLNIFEKDI